MELLNQYLNSMKPRPSCEFFFPPTSHSRYSHAPGNFSVTAVPSIPHLSSYLLPSLRYHNISLTSQHSLPHVSINKHRYNAFLHDKYVTSYHLALSKVPLLDNIIADLHRCRRHLGICPRPQHFRYCSSLCGKAWRRRPSLGLLFCGYDL